MAFGINKSRLTPIAIDFGADTLKMLQISGGDDAVQLVGAGCLVIPETARKDSAARFAFLADAVKELIRQQPFKGRRVMCAIPSFQTMVSSLELQCSENDDLDQQVNLHLQTVMEKDPSRMVVRNQRVGTVVRDGSTRQRVISMAASRAMVMRYIEMATAAKLEVVGMHSEPMCIARGFSELYNQRQQDKNEARCFVDIGAAATKLVIVRDEQVLMARNIHVCGDDLTRRYAKEHHLGFAEARIARIQKAANPLSVGGVPMSADSIAQLDEIERELDARMTDQSVAVEDEPGDRRNGGRVEPMLPAPFELDETLDTLIDGIRMTVRYHNSVCPDSPVERVVMLGGEAHHKAVAETVAHAFGVPTFVGDPLARVMRTPGVNPLGVDMNQPQPGWAVPLGLCLSEANL